MGYRIDLSAITIDSYQEMLATRHLIPSQGILKEDIERRFLWFRENGISNVSELVKLLSDADTASEMIDSGHFSTDYIKVLLRHIKGMIGKPRKLSDFRWIAGTTIDKLQSAGIKNTAQLYEGVKSHESIRAFADQLSLDEAELTVLVKQTDLTRIQWVNHTFARVLYEAGYDTVQKVQAGDYEAMYTQVTELNRARELYKGNIGLNDMKVLVEVSSVVKPEIDY